MGKLGEFCTWDALGPKDIEYVQLADAVIEAAKAWRERMLKYAVCEQEYTLMAAVEELLAAEKGEP